MKPEMMKQLADGIIEAVKAHVTARLAPLEQHVAETERRAAGRIEALERKVAELERAAEAKATPDSRWLKAV